MLIDGCWQVVGGWWLRLRRLLFWMGVAVGLVLGVGGVFGRRFGPWGSSILPSVVRSSRVGRACGGRQGQCHLGLSGRCGIGAAEGVTRSVGQVEFV